MSRFTLLYLVIPRYTPLYPIHSTISQYTRQSSQHFMFLPKNSQCISATNWAWNMSTRCFQRESTELWANERLTFINQIENCRYLPNYWHFCCMLFAIGVTVCRIQNHVQMNIWNTKSVMWNLSWFVRLSN